MAIQDEYENFRNLFDLQFNSVSNNSLELPVNQEAKKNYIKVNCKECNETWLKRKNTLRKWEGRCKTCSNLHRHNKKLMIDFRNKQWLIQVYLKNKKSPKEISKECNVNPSVIRRYLYKFDIPTRTQSETKKLNRKKRYQQKEYLINEYHFKKNSITKIAKKNNVIPATIFVWLKNNSILTRSKSEQTSLRNHNRFSLNKSQWEILEGELLGDGCLTKSFTNPSFCLGSIEKEHLQHIMGLFPKNFFKITKPHKNGVGRIYTPHLSILLKLHHNYYRNGRKDLPEDFKLTPLKLKYWYYGDGSLMSKRYPCICNTLFDREKLEKILIPQLLSNGIDVSIYNDMIRIKSKSVKSFFDYIGQPIRCYSYKWK